MRTTKAQSLIRTFVVRCLDSIISLAFYVQNVKPLASFCFCAGRFKSYLVENPEDRFSRDEAQLIIKHVTTTSFFMVFSHTN